MKKLQLNKETIASLNTANMSTVKGGGSVILCFTDGCVFTNSNNTDPKCYTECGCAWTETCETVLSACC
jgi:hypothetical protein